MNTKWLRAGCAAAAVAMMAAGCTSAAGGSGTTGADQGSQGGHGGGTLSAMKSLSFGPPEKKTVSVGVVPAVDSAGFFVALHQGLFAKEGLTVNYTPETSSETAISQQRSGKLDLTAGNYVSYVQAASKGAPFEIVAEASVMQRGSRVLFTMPDSNIRTLSQLKGHMVGVNAPGNIDYLLAASALAANGTSSGVSYPSKPVPFDQMGPMLKSGQLSAAVLPEPFASEAEQRFGAVPLAELNQGATQSFPIEGYVATKQWAEQNPNTLGRFLAALEAGQETADTDRAAVETAFESLKGARNGQVPANISSVMSLDNYPIGIDVPRLQRVSNLMYQFGLEPGQKKPFNVQSMVMPSGKFNFAPFVSSESASS